MAVLVVDFAGFGDGESFVSFCDFDEFLLGFLIPPTVLLAQSWKLCRLWREDAVRVLIGMVFLAQGAVCALDVSFGGLLVDS